jgi:hypothetical protein
MPISRGGRLQLLLHRETSQPLASNMHRRRLAPPEGHYVRLQCGGSSAAEIAANNGVLRAQPIASFYQEAAFHSRNRERPVNLSGAAEGRDCAAAHQVPESPCPPHRAPGGQSVGGRNSPMTCKAPCDRKNTVVISTNPGFMTLLERGLRGHLASVAQGAGR